MIIPFIRYFLQEEVPSLSNILYIRGFNSSTQGKREDSFCRVTAWGRF